MFVGLHVEHLLFLSDFKKNQCVYRKFDENPKYQSSQIPVWWELLLRHTVGQMDRQTDRKADKMKWIVDHVVTRKDLHTEKICNCLTNTVIAPDKDCYFGAYWPLWFSGCFVKTLCNLLAVNNEYINSSTVIKP